MIGLNSLEIFPRSKISKKFKVKIRWLRLKKYKLLELEKVVHTCILIITKVSVNGKESQNKDKIFNVYHYDGIQNILFIIWILR